MDFKTKAEKGLWFAKTFGLLQTSLELMVNIILRNNSHSQRVEQRCAIRKHVAKLPFHDNLSSQVTISLLFQSRAKIRQ